MRSAVSKLHIYPGRALTSNVKLVILVRASELISFITQLAESTLDEFFKLTPLNQYPLNPHLRSIISIEVLTYLPGQSRPEGADVLMLDDFPLAQLPLLVQSSIDTSSEIIITHTEG